jgi:hypothetical protein
VFHYLGRFEVGKGYVVGAEINEIRRQVEYSSSNNQEAILVANSWCFDQDERVKGWLVKSQHFGFKFWNTVGDTGGATSPTQLAQ